MREILVVDDDRTMVRTLADVLGLKGWSVNTAHTGEAAVAAVEERPFTLVLMDVKMDGMSGVDALKEIRARRPQTRVILMTAYTTSELVEEARRAGVVEVLSKPLALPHLLHLVENVEDADAGGGPEAPVLVVDDDPDFLRGLCDILEDHGVRTHRAQRLHEAIRLLEERGRIRAVLLDLRLNGFLDSESVLAIRKVRPEVLMILFSGYHEQLERVVADLPEGWIIAALTKPFDPGELIGILEQLDD